MCGHEQSRNEKKDTQFKKKKKGRKEGGKIYIYSQGLNYLTFLKSI